jgi:hypothetical protein
VSEALTKDGEEIDLSIPEEHRENGLQHISKSRIKIFLTCPRKFFNKYWAENRAPGSYHTEKGSRIHRVYEEWHLALIEWVEEHGRRPQQFSHLLTEWRDHFQWHDPHLVNFFMFEEKRWELALEQAEKFDREQPLNERALNLWLPVAVEAKGYLEEPPAGNIPWMGYADAVLHAATVPQVEENEGVVILDYKTGKTEDAKYRDEGIYLEGEFYGWLFEEDPDFEHKVVAVGGYYPQNDDLVISPYPDYQRRNVILDAVEGMQQPPEEENYPINENPLCHYGHGKCFFYDVCDTTWGKKGGAGYHNKAEPDGSVTPK